MIIKTKYNIGDTVYVIDEPANDKTAKHNVRKEEICNIEIIIGEDKSISYESYILNNSYSDRHKQSRFYIEEKQENKRIFSTEEEANNQAKYLTKKRLEEIKEERKEEKEYQKKLIKEEIENLKIKAKKLNIKL